jgi:2-dehydro-3-deoxyphosphogluconate aldolase/(4S)-4-hydroxy-2-oxoglutarate aldolase
MINPIERIMRTSPVIPVLVSNDVGEARELAEALIEGGLKVLEVTLRTPNALQVIRRMKLVRGGIVGAGTVLNHKQAEEAASAGAEFFVSPGLTEQLAVSAHKLGVPLLPGVATAGDIMRGMDLGLEHFKFFPAITSGGIPALKALAGPFHTAKFCPTGGISEANAPEWLALKNVLCVGGSWVVPTGADAETIYGLAQAAAALRPGGTGGAAQ